jgi:hypothetical protein
MLELTKSPIGHGQGVVNSGRLRHALERAFEIANRFLEASFDECQLTQSAERSPREPVERGLKLQSCFGATIEAEVDVTKIESHDVIVWSGFERRVIEVHGLFQSARLLMQVTKEMGPPEIVGLHSAGISVACLRRIKDLVGMVELAEGPVGVREIRAAEIGFRNKIANRLLDLPDLLGDRRLERVEVGKGNGQERWAGGGEHTRA